MVMIVCGEGGCHCGWRICGEVVNLGGGDGGEEGRVGG